MRQLYKYLPPERVDVPEKLRIRFTQLPGLNDPLESQPLFTMRKEIQPHVDGAREYLKQLYQEFFMAEERSEEERREARAVLNREYRGFVEHANTLEKRGVPPMRESLFENDGGPIGILSLSEDALNPIMWAHYADCHRGFVIGFDWSDPFLHLNTVGEGRTDPKEMIYKSVRPRVHYLSPSFYDDLFCTKSLHWAYEREFRVFRVLRDGENVGNDALGYSVRLFDFDASAVRSVIFGYHAEPSLIQAVSEALKASDDVRFARARPSVDRYALEVVDLSAPA